MNDAADYRKRFAARPQPLTLEQAARITPPTRATDTEAPIDVPRMRAWRLNRLREQIAAHGLDAVILAEPLSIRYATGVRNCALFQMHILAGYLFVPASGPVVYFDSEPGRNTGSSKRSTRSATIICRCPTCSPARGSGRWRADGPRRRAIS